jgi:hypothetical protein
MRLVICCVLACLMVRPGVAAGAEPSEARELLGTYEQTVARLTPIRIEGETKDLGNPASQKDPAELNAAAVRSDHLTIFRDGSRTKIGMITHFASGALDEFELGIEYLEDDFLGIRQGLHVNWQRRRSENPPRFSVLGLVLQGKPLGIEQGRYLKDAGVLFGQTLGDGWQPLWKVMSEATTLELLPDPEVIAGHSTRVVKSRGRNGAHILWLDPEFGCLPRQIAIDKGSGEFFGEIQLGVEQSPAARIPAGANVRNRPLQANYSLEESHERFDKIQLEEKQGRFVVTAFDQSIEQTRKTADKTTRSKSRTEFRAQTVDFAPDTWPATAFKPSIEIPDGTPVIVGDRTQPRRVWKNGTIE